MKKFANKSIIFLILIIFTHACSSDKNESELVEFECACEQKVDVDLLDLIGVY